MDQSMITTYQKIFADMLGVPYAYTFWKGRVALYAILQALGITQGDEVILPGFTCVVVPNVIRAVGAIPVYADIESETYNIDPRSVEQAITPRTRAVLAQHTFGIPANMAAIKDITTHHHLALIEDCAHALGSTYKGRAVGTLGTAAFFSSQWSKPYTTGLGGIATTADPVIGDRLRTVQCKFVFPPTLRLWQLRLQYTLYQWFFSPQVYWRAMKILHRLSRWNLFIGSSSDYELNGATPLDMSWKMSPFQCRVGITELQCLSQKQIHRKELTAIYLEALEKHGWPLLRISDDVHTVYLRIPIRVANKSELIQQAATIRIELGSWFESVLHPVQRALERFGYHQGRCPMAEQTAQQVINLPLHSRVSLKEARRIVDFVCRNAVTLRSRP
jgi:dTDP-4-amino-4,6-dideoxygalactose transaminase